MDGAISLGLLSTTVWLIQQKPALQRSDSTVGCKIPARQSVVAKICRANQRGRMPSSNNSAEPPLAYPVAEGRAPLRA